ncbi:hypothetical protein BTA51_04665 [Hahella sp. CCB-MM4]|uniref:alginate O-acetyltransferase n=1 Tax=Hahella sp. (strain CCB-MM4) TaxID=1926491 RepID=UPI000B9A32D6|nr:alginate O-acetyltransferase [Hahella sp. CCB-MM4]OZG74310.1 hypothetical protein BTA51_04665 [Hahella sp. CCB-MM4]
MEKWAHQLYVAVFIVLVVALGVWSLGAWRDFQQPEEISAIDGGWAQQYESHYNEEFPVKNFGTSFWAAVQYLLFSEGREGVVVGNDEWLFTQEEFKAYPDFADRVNNQLELISQVKQYLDNQGVDLAVVIVPSKARVYAEHLQDSMPYEGHKDLYFSAVEKLLAKGIHSPLLLPGMMEGKDQARMFLRTDTHWTPEGAAIAASEIVRQLEPKEKNMEWHTKAFETVSQKPREHKGDLLNYIPLDPYFAYLGPGTEPLLPRETFPLDSEDQASGMDDDLFGESSAEVALVGTSYSANPLWNFVGALQQQAGVEVISYAQEGKGPVIPMMEYLLSDDFLESPPNVVIWEFPERYIPMSYDLSEYALPFTVAGNSSNSLNHQETNTFNRQETNNSDSGRIL